MNLSTSRRGAALLSLAAVVGLAGCESMNDMSAREKGTAQGAGVGAVAGAVLGKVTGSSAGKGAVIGAAAGAVAGNLWSKRMEDKRMAMERATAGTGIDVARTPDNQLKVNIPSDFSFDVGRADIKPVMRPVLDQFAQGLDPAMLVRIVGHTDSTGSDAINEPLSIQRATSVRNYLADRGVNGSRTEVLGRGAREPVAENSSESGRAMNRRVEIFLSDPQG